MTITNAGVAAQEPSEHACAQQIEIIEQKIRLSPAEPSHRWALFQWLCVARDWERAIRQLQVFGQLDSASTSVVQACRDLVRAERWRERVMAGEKAPGLVIEAMPPWMDGLLTALRLASQDETEAADTAREAALNAAPSVAGKSGNLAFDWIADSDSRLGPVCEIIVAGSYRWLSIDNIVSWRIAKPAGLLDVIWAPCSITLRDGTELRGFMPARYAPAHDAAAAGEASDSALAMGRRTEWRRLGRSGVIGVGGKTWATSAGDAGLFELGDCVFDPPDGEHAGVMP